VIQNGRGHAVGILAYGTSHWAVVESLDQLKQEAGIEAGYCRLRAFPFNDQVKDFIRQHERIYVVEQNRDGQMHSLLRMEIDADDVKKLRSVRHYNGIPIDARSITDSIVSQEEN
jgi:2-oxoglutarate ferredoxin oxidoreductase subunit alpha